MKELLSANQVAERLGVELATVYAYASRGALTRQPGPDGRRSAYDPDEVELLARRARPRSTRRRTGAVDVVIGTTVSEIGDGWIRYRDHDVVELASWATFEDVCRLLWTGDLHSTPSEQPHPQVRAAVKRVSAALPQEASVTSRLAAGAAAGAPWIPRAKTVESAVASATMVLDALVESLPLIDRDADTSGPIAERLWPRVSPEPITPERRRALDTTLVLMAEHELATSTLAVRVAASTRAKPAEVVLAGLGTMSGPLHGRAAVRVHRRLDEGLGPADTTMLDGFGHPVHHSGDPRFEPLITQALGIASAERRAVIEAYIAPRRGASPPNCDAALGALGYAMGAQPGATEAIFAIARTAGWLAHAFEEADEPPVRFRGRTLYRGPR